MMRFITEASLVGLALLEVEVEELVLEVDELLSL